MSCSSVVCHFVVVCSEVPFPLCLQWCYVSLPKGMVLGLREPGLDLKKSLLTAEGSWKCFG